MKPSALGAFLIFVASSVHGETIRLSAAMPVKGQAETITVPGLGAGGVISITDSDGVVTQLTADASDQVLWTPTECGKYTVSCGAATQTLWVTARPMTFHWWSATTAQANVTEIMSNDAAWDARGVSKVAWTGGEAYSRGVDGHYWTQPSDWVNGWSYAYTTGGMAMDEIHCDGTSPTNEIVQAINTVRQQQGPEYSINVWTAGITPDSSFASNAAILKACKARILIEDYYGTWALHSSRWADVRRYGLQDQAISGIWPGTSNLTNEAEVRADIALVRLAAPAANGIAIFAPATNLLVATDRAIEDYFLKPLIHLTVTADGKLQTWNLGNDVAAGFSLQFLNSANVVVQTVDLSGLAANGQSLLGIPSGAVNAKVINPAGTANLYTGNSLYSTGLYPLTIPGRYTWTNANGDRLWSTFSDWSPSGPPPGNIDSGNYAYFDGNVSAPVSVTAKSGETSINSVRFVTPGWTIAGDATSQSLFTYAISSAGAGTNTVNIGYRTTAGVAATFSVDAGNTLVMNGCVSGPNGIYKNGSGDLVLTYPNTFAGASSISAGKVIAEPGALQGTVTNNATLQLGRSTAANLPSSLRVNGSGLTILTDNNSGYINLTAANQLSSGGDLTATAVNINQSGFNQAVGGLGGNGFWYNNASPCTLSVGNNGGSATFTGTLADSGAGHSLSLVKAGAGIQTLNGGSYSGTTTVSNGTLRVNGSLGNTATTVAAAGTLGGSGSITGTVTVIGAIAPGSGVGTLTTGSMVMAGQFLCEVDGASVDKLEVNGSLNLTGSTLSVALLAGGFTQAHHVIATSTSLTGTFASVPAGYRVKYGQGAGSNEIWLEASPDFAGWALVHAPGQTLDMDHDNDGIPNGIEYFAGLTGASFSANPGVSDNRKISWPKGASYSGVYGTDYLVQTSPDLIEWTDVSVADPRLNIGSSLEYTLPDGNMRTFTRLKVTGP